MSARVKNTAQRDDANGSRSVFLSAATHFWPKFGPPMRRPRTRGRLSSSSPLSHGQNSHPGLSSPKTPVHTPALAMADAASVAAAAAPEFGPDAAGTAAGPAPQAKKKVKKELTAEQRAAETQKRGLLRKRLKQDLLDAAKKATDEARGGEDTSDVVTKTTTAALLMIGINPSVAAIGAATAAAMARAELWTGVLGEERPECGFCL